MESLAVRLHQLFNQQKRFSFPFQEKKDEIPSNGIYVIFEKGEIFHGMDRITRVGTHTGENQLFSRLNQHFLKENKNRSIFRKNIGRSLLHKENHPYAKEWEYDTTSREGKEKYAELLNLELEKELEKRISTHIHENLSFVVFEVETEEDRLFWEEKIIATLSQAANHWLGNSSHIEKIRKSGLWLVQGLDKEGLTEEEFEKLKQIVSAK